METHKNKIVGSPRNSVSMIVRTSKAAEAIGPYSQAVKSGKFVFCSGQIALNLKGKLISGGIKEQTKQAIENLKNILEAAGSSLDKAVKVTVYLININDFKEMNEVYSQYFKNKPARSTVAVKELPRNARVEIDVVADV